MGGLWLVATLVALDCTASAAPTPQQLEFFEKRIRPVLAQECYECHSAEGKKKGGLLLDSRPGWQAGGESGDAIVPGNPEASLLLQTLRHEHEDLKMPKNGAKLEKRIIADFAKWIAEGAVDPRDAPPNKEQLAAETSWEAVLAGRKQWWSFQPVRTIDDSEVGRLSTPAAIDYYLNEKLAEAGLKPAPQATPATMIRRLNFVLTGLPPTPAEVAAFEQACKNDTQAAIATLVDRLLASPHYGEHWARHWMDWIRYAESYGSEGDPAIPYAWRYRDYLIRAFNEDVPYPQMLREAIAGDLLPNPRINQKTDINESALGIAQLRMVLHGFSPTDSLDELITFTDNQIDTVTKAFQGLTVSCARCHNHKFDPISQTDFYALYGIFTSTRPAVIDANAPNVGKAQRAELAGLKEQIRDVVGRAWLAAVKVGPVKKVKEEAVKAVKVEPAKHWDLRKDKWFANGNGVAQGATKAGEFSVDAEGKGIIARIHPGGVFSDLISTKDRGVLMSPRFKCEGGTLWLRTAGGGGAKAKYVVQHYPRTGTIHKAKEFKDTGDGALGWQKLDLSYWKGDEIYIQCITAADMPAEAKTDARSWFGITEAFISQGSETPPEPGIAGDAGEAIEAWLTNSTTDAQAELLDKLLRGGKLPNNLDAIPAAAPLLAAYRKVEAALPPPTRAPGVLEADAFDAVLFEQGDHKRPSGIVPRRFLESLDATPYRPANSGRLELAQSLTSPSNPLTSRVIVNRLWHHLFGRGLVATTDNFGRLGETPTHPNLLDYLAQRFSQSGGSIKQMVRDIVLTAAFQRAAAPPTATDPDNKMLAHWTVRRLEAEAIRDSILTLSGKMSEEMYGEPVYGKDGRRSVYVGIVRNSLDSFLTAFDMPVPFSTRGRRDVTNVPAQSLALLNDPVIMNWASSWAKQAIQEPNDNQRIERMFAQALGRRPSADETAASLKFVEASAVTAQEQQRELAEIESKATEIQNQIDGVLVPLRASLMKQRPVNAATASGTPKPFAEWDFEKDGSDNQGRLPLTLEGSARIDNGALVLDGRTSFARSARLPKSLANKTLEAWVLLDSLEQSGGGVMTIQDPNGAVFDSIVFAEKRPNEWLSGSNHFKRTRDFNGVPDIEAAKRPVHIAIVYDGSKVIAFRDGQMYGKGYKVDEPAKFAAGEAEVLLGCRHGSAGGDRVLRGRILRARLYDRALSVPEIAASRQVEATVVTERDVLDALNDEQRSEVRQWQADREQVTHQADALRERLTRLSPETAGWESLALSIINLKEFIYLQ